MATAQADNFFYFKRPVIISYKALFSFYVKPGTTTKELAFVVDPVITFWNPYDVPISLSPAYNSIRFLKIPYQINGLTVTVGDATKTVGAVNLGGKGSSNFASTTDYNYLTLRAGKTSPIVLRPGEVLVYAQPANTAPVKGDVVNNSNTIDGKAGYSFGGGIYYPMKDSAGAPVTIPATTNTSQQVVINFSSITPNQETIVQGVSGSASVSVNHSETYLFEDRNSLGPFLGIGGTFVDFWKGLHPHTAVKPNRFTADQKTGTFKSFPAGSVTIDAQAGATNDLKKPFLYYSYDAKTEEDSLRGGQFLSRLNPSAPTVDFGDLSDAELDTLPFEIHIESNTSSALNSVIDQDPANGRGFFGGGSTGNFGSTFVTTHSVPREPLVSLAALQHSMANGFNRDKPDTTGAAYGFSPLDQYSNHSIRLPMLPQISHAVGNSLAPSVLAKDQTEGALSGGRALADHSYLANKAVVINSGDVNFRGGDVYFYNHAGKPVLGYVGTSKFLLNPGQGKLLRPEGAKEETYYDVGFGVREAEGDRVMRTMRWPVLTRSRSYVFFYQNPVKDRIDYRAVDEFVAPPEENQAAPRDD